MKKKTSITNENNQTDSLENENLYSTPAMRQFEEVKKNYPDCIIFFRMGDFYEMFGEDAVKASRILEIALTKRNNITMCGVPYHAKDKYLMKMIKDGVKVVICDQLEDPKFAKGVVKRGVTEVITPGTVVEMGYLDNDQHNYLISLQISGNTVGIAGLDISTLDLFIAEEKLDNVYQYINDELYHWQPNEIIIPDSLMGDDKLQTILINYNPHITINYFKDIFFDKEFSEKALLSIFKTKSLKGFGIEEKYVGIGSAGCLLKYVKDMKLKDISYIGSCKLYKKTNYLQLSESAIKSLELVNNLSDGTKRYTLFELMNVNKTSMGSRLLMEWILRPLLDVDGIIIRQEVVKCFKDNYSLLNEIRTHLEKIRDLERLSSRLALHKISPRELIALKDSLNYSLEAMNIINNIGQFSYLKNKLHDVSEEMNYIDRTILPEPANDLSEGGVINFNFNEELDSLKKIGNEGIDYINELQEREKIKLNIPNLRIKFNKVVGYFVEISKGQVKNIPDNYITKQSLTNTIRYTFKELQEYEGKVLNAKERIISIETQIYEEVLQVLTASIIKIKELGEAIAEIDVLLGFSYLSIQKNYVCPKVDDSNQIIIHRGRHPVVEHYLEEGTYVANDVTLDYDKNTVLIITGPNMSGKSTYLRQTALITIMAQMGCFIPAEYAKIGFIDKLFTRIGASDNITRGESTFLVEMSETSNILNNASMRSLIIMDEIGRGTSTYDGMALAWSIIEYLSNSRNKIGRTMFATHYHELTQLADLKGIINLHILVKEIDDQIIFMHKVVEGCADRSYGIEVAKLAGLPKKVVDRATEILEEIENKRQSLGKILEENNLINPLSPNIKKKSKEKIFYDDIQGNLF